VIYRQRKDKDGEVAILERFAHQKHAPGATPPKLLERLARISAR
jgi:DNA polymerase III subunit epsilon